MSDQVGNQNVGFLTSRLILSILSRLSRYLEVELKASIRSYRFSFVRDFMKFATGSDSL